MKKSARIVTFTHEYKIIDSTHFHEKYVESEFVSANWWEFRLITILESGTYSIAREAKRSECASPKPREASGNLRMFVENYYTEKFVQIFCLICCH